MSIKVNNTLGITVRDIANNRNIPYITVETVIKTYIADLIKSAENGERVVIDGLTSITVIRGSIKDYTTVKKSLPKRIRDIALKKGITMKTVEYVIRDYLDSLIILAQNSENIKVHGLTEIAVEPDATGELVVRGKISPYLRSRLEMIGSGEFHLSGRVSHSLKKRVNDCHQDAVVLV